MTTDQTPPDAIALLAEAICIVDEAMDDIPDEMFADAATRGSEPYARALLASHPPLAEALSFWMAWKAAEDALPEGWWLHSLNAWSFSDMAYRAEACGAGSRDDLSERQSDKPFGTVRFTTGPSVYAFGPTPDAALLALAARLREARG